MLRTSFFSTSGLLCCFASALSGSEPFLLYVDQIEDRLIRVNLDGTSKPIGEPGAVGFPTVTLVGRDASGGNLYGLDTQLWLIVEIDPTTSIGTFLAFADSLLNVPSDYTLKPNDDTLYVTGNDGGIDILNPYDGTQIVSLSTQIVPSAVICCFLQCIF